MKVDRILVPVDFSGASMAGVKMAANIAEIYGSTVDLIHVVPIISYFNESFDLMEIPLDPEKDIYPKALKIVAEKLHEVSEKYIPKEHRGQLLNVVGRKVFREVTEEGNRNADMIVMSNKGSHKSDALRSNITEKIIQYSKIPVLSISDNPEADEINNILVPLDRTKNGAYALIPAFGIARIFKAELTVMHIVEPYTLGMEVPETITDNEETIYEILMKNVNLYLQDHPKFNLKLERTGHLFEDRLIYTDAGRSDSIPFKSIVKKGLSADREICDYANEKADLVVMSTHGRKGISRFLLGSTTAMVAQNLDKPLLTFRPQ